MRMRRIPLKVDFNNQGGKAIRWPTIDELLSFLKNYGFECLRRQPIDFPVGGEHLILRMTHKN